MKKLNLICASIALLAAGAANAGTVVSTATKVAVENFGGSGANQDQLAIKGAAISYSMSTITAVNSGSTVYFTVRLTGGKFRAAPASTAFTFAGQACQAGTASATAPQCVVSLSSDKSTIKVAVTTAASYTLGLGAFGYTPAWTNTTTGDVVGVNSTLASSGGKVSASIGLVTIDPGTGTALDSANAQQNIDGALGTGDLAVGVRAITGTVSATGSASYTGKIDLTANPAASDFTTAGYAILGSYKFKNATAGTALQLDGATDYTVAAGSANGANTGVSVTVTPGSGQAFPIGSVLSLNTNVGCGAGTKLAGSDTSAVTSANATAAKTMTTTTAVAADPTEYFVCITKPSSTNTASPIQAQISATIAAGATNDLIAAATGTGYNLAYNGSTVNVYSYWPGGLSAYNFTGYLRVTNTGSVAADVSLAHISPTDGSAGVSKVIIAGLSAGKTVLLTTQAIDAVVGVAPSGVAVGRARVTAPTDGLRVQSLLQFNSGNLVEFSN